MINLLTPVALLLAVAAQILKTTQSLLALPIWLNSAAVVVLAFVVSRVPPPPRPPPGLPTASGRASVLGWLLTLGGGTGAVACSVWLWEDWQVALFSVFIAGPAALIALAVGLDRLWGYTGGGRLTPPGVTWREWVVLLATVIVALAFCFWHFDFFPPSDGFSSIEEAQRATGARWILERGARPWEWPLPQYSIAASFTLFGYSMTALRLPAILLGCATLVPFYLFVREMVAAPAALAATALLAVARWHVQVSWYNEDVYIPVFPFTLILYLLVRTRREPRPSLYVLAAVCCGYTLYDYAAFRITPVIALAFFVAEWFRRRPLRDRAQVAVFCGVLLLFVVPLAGILRQSGLGGYTEALQRSLANKSYYTENVESFVSQRWKRIVDSADMFTLSDHEAFLPSLNTRGEALLDPFTGVLFVLGFGTTVLLPLRRFHAFVTLTFLFLMLGTTVVVQNLDFRRLSILLPFVFAYVALAVDKLDIAAAQLRVQRFLRAALVPLVALAGAYNFHFLFHVLAPAHAVRAYHRDEYTPVLFFLRNHVRGEHVVYVSPYVRNMFLPNDYDWLKAPDLSGQVAIGIETIFPFDPPVPEQRDVVMVIARPYDIDTVMAQVRDVYPGSTCETHADPDDSKWDLGVCRLTAESVRQGVTRLAAGEPVGRPQTE